MGDVYSGQIQGGVVVLDEGAPPWPDGLRVWVEPIATPEQTPVPEPPSLAERYAAFIGIAEGLPDDLAGQHDHYIHGTPRRPEG